MKFSALSILLVLDLLTTAFCTETETTAAPTCAPIDGADKWMVDLHNGTETQGFQHIDDFAKNCTVKIIQKYENLGDVSIKATEATTKIIEQHGTVKAINQNSAGTGSGRRAWLDESQSDSLRGGGRYLAEETPYGIKMVRAAELPNLPSDKSWKKVCVVDTGYDNDHPDLPKLNTATDGESSYKGQTWYKDVNGHGTHCAGIIGAIGGNDVGVDSVMNTYGSGFKNFFIAKGLEDNGTGQLIGLVSALEDCIANGASVVSMSLGGPDSIESYEDAVETLHLSGILVVAAAGDAGNFELRYPASYTHAMSVAAVDSDKRRASFSQYNNQVEISAPGVSIKSTWKDKTYKLASGTSMAAAHVAGAAGLVWSHFPECSHMQIRYALAKTAVPSEDQPRCNNEYGHGVVDAKAAYDFLEKTPCRNWPKQFQDWKYVETGCYVPEDDNKWPETKSSSISAKSLSSNMPPAITPSSASSSNTLPPTSASLDGCEWWCDLVSVPWKPTSDGGLAKCAWTDYCDKCPECTCRSWCSDIPATDIPWNSTSGELSKCGTMEMFCQGCAECS